MEFFNYLSSSNGAKVVECSSSKKNQSPDHLLMEERSVRPKT